jgi:hypothetical protein
MRYARLQIMPSSSEHVPTSYSIEKRCWVYNPNTDEFDANYENNKNMYTSAGTAKLTKQKDGAYIYKSDSYYDIFLPETHQYYNIIILNWKKYILGDNLCEKIGEAALPVANIILRMYTK